MINDNLKPRDQRIANTERDWPYLGLDRITIKIHEVARAMDANEQSSADHSASGFRDLLIEHETNIVWICAGVVCTTRWK